MYRKINDFITDWKSEVNSTVKIFSAVTEEIKSFKANDNVRTIERIAWHITQTLTEMPHKAGIVDQDFLDQKPIPEKFELIIECYKNYSQILEEQINKKWSDEMLTEKIEVYGQSWARKNILSVLIKHQIHHRAQITILMRLAKTKVPGIYGPSKEEWTQFGMEPQD